MCFSFEYITEHSPGSWVFILLLIRRWFVIMERVILSQVANFYWCAVCMLMVLICCHDLYIFFSSGFISKKNKKKKKTKKSHAIKNNNNNNNKQIRQCNNNRAASGWIWYRMLPTYVRAYWFISRIYFLRLFAVNGTGRPNNNTIEDEDGKVQWKRICLMENGISIDNVRILCINKTGWNGMFSVII